MLCWHFLPVAQVFLSPALHRVGFTLPSTLLIRPLALLMSYILNEKSFWGDKFFQLYFSLLLMNLKPTNDLDTMYSLMHSTYLDNNEIFFIVYPPCIGQCVPQFNETFIELRYALVIVIHFNYEPIVSTPYVLSKT